MSLNHPWVKGMLHRSPNLITWLNKCLKKVKTQIPKVYFESGGKDERELLPGEAETAHSHFPALQMIWPHRWLRPRCTQGAADEQQNAFDPWRNQTLIFPETNRERENLRLLVNDSFSCHLTDGDRNYWSHSCSSKLQINIKNSKA